MRFALPVALSLALCGCAGLPTAPSAGDDALQWPAQAAELYFINASGQTISPFQPLDAFSREAVVGIPGYIFTKRGSLLMHPGEQWIHFQCPEPRDVAVSHWWPGVKYSFFAGHAYELRCEGSQPVIRARQGGA